MNSLQFVSALIASFVALSAAWAWPVVILLLVLIFQKRFDELIGSAEEIATPWITIKRAKRRLRRAATALAATPGVQIYKTLPQTLPEEVKDIASRMEGLRSQALTAPVAAITEAFSLFDEAVEWRARRQKVEIDVAASLPVALVESLAAEGAVPEALAEAARTLQEVAAAALRGGVGAFASEDALLYLSLARQAVELLAQNPSRERIG